MNRLRCHTCDSLSLEPIPVDVLEEEAAGDGPKESRFYACPVCGDNWLSLRAFGEAGDSHLTFIHQMGIEPVLKRVVHMPSAALRGDDTLDMWHYFVDDEETDRARWLQHLERRRKLLRSVSFN